MKFFPCNGKITLSFASPEKENLYIYIYDVITWKKFHKYSELYYLCVCVCVCVCVIITANTQCNVRAYFQTSAYIDEYIISITTTCIHRTTTVGFDIIVIERFQTSAHIAHSERYHTAGAQHTFVYFLLERAPTMNVNIHSSE